MKNTKNGLFEKFKNSQIENDVSINGGANETMTYMGERTYVGTGGDFRHICDTTLSGVVVIGVTFPG